MNKQFLNPISIIIPVYNESENLSFLLDEIDKDLKDELKTEVIVVDDGSKDASFVIAKEHNVKVIRHKENKGYGESLRTGVKYAKYPIIVFLDGDGKYDPNDILQCIRPITEGRADMVWGSRLDVTSIQNRKRIGNIILDALFVLLTRMNTPLFDSSSGLYCFKKDVFNSLNLKSKDFVIRYEILAKLMQKGYRIIEVPVKQRMRFSLTEHYSRPSFMNLLFRGMKNSLDFYKLLLGGNL